MFRLSWYWCPDLLAKITKESGTGYLEENLNLSFVVAIKQLHQQIQDLKEEVKELKEKPHERNKRSSYE